MRGYGLAGLRNGERVRRHAGCRQDSWLTAHVSEVDRELDAAAVVNRVPPFDRNHGYAFTQPRRVDDKRAENQRQVDAGRMLPWRRTGWRAVRLELAKLS